LSRKDQIVARLAAVLPPDALMSDIAETRAYECDALTAYRCRRLPWFAIDDRAGLGRAEDLP